MFSYSADIEEYKAYSWNAKRILGGDIYAIIGSYEDMKSGPTKADSLIPWYKNSRSPNDRHALTSFQQYS
jgi:hypothetical protein